MGYRHVCEIKTIWFGPLLICGPRLTTVIPVLSPTQGLAQLPQFWGVGRCVLTPNKGLQLRAGSRMESGLG